VVVNALSDSIRSMRAYPARIMLVRCHPHWKPGQGWAALVTFTFVEAGGERLVLDPLAPPAGTCSQWRGFSSGALNIPATLELS
jgi:hypothetical protein